VPPSTTCITGLHTLNSRQQVRIKTKLNERGCLSGACELGFHDFVRPRTEGAGLVDPNEEVDRPPHGAVQKCGLINGIDAFTYRPDCLRNGIVPTTVDVDSGQLKDRPSSQFAQVSLLVLKPQLSQQIDCCVLEEGLDDLVLGLGTGERRRVGTGKEARLCPLRKT